MCAVCAEGSVCTGCAGGERLCSVCRGERVYRVCRRGACVQGVGMYVRVNCMSGVKLSYLGGLKYEMLA